MSEEMRHTSVLHTNYGVWYSQLEEWNNDTRQLYYNERLENYSANIRHISQLQTMSFTNLSKNSVFAVQMWLSRVCDEELTGVVVGAIVGH